MVGAEIGRQRKLFFFFFESASTFLPNSLNDLLTMLNRSVVMLHADSVLVVFGSILLSLIKLSSVSLVKCVHVNTVATFSYVTTEHVSAGGFLCGPFV